jgi:hypothetical protein
MIFKNKPSRYLLVHLCFFLFSSFIIVSCDYLTESEIFENKEAVQSPGGVKLKDYNTGELCLNEKQIYFNTKLLIEPDSGMNNVTVVGVDFDSVAAEPHYRPHETYWVSSIHSRGEIHIGNNNIIYFVYYSEWQGKHTIRFHCKITNPKSGLEFLSPKRDIIEIVLDFK